MMPGSWKKISWFHEPKFHDPEFMISWTSWTFKKFMKIHDCACLLLMNYDEHSWIMNIHEYSWTVSSWSRVHDLMNFMNIHQIHENSWWCKCIVSWIIVNYLLLEVHETWTFMNCHSVVGRDWLVHECSWCYEQSF